MDPELLKQISPKDFYEAHLKEGVRPDTREVYESRKCAITLNEAQNSCMVRLGNTSVVCSLLQGTGVEGFEGLGFLGMPQGKVLVSVLADDGNLLEAVAICYQIVNGTNDFLFPFTYSEVFKHFVRDPNKEEENLSDCLFTIFLSSSKFSLIKSKGTGISFSDVKKIVESLDDSIEKARKNLEFLSSNKTFIGTFY
jgi:exosome complex RNA-binding protein Rrp42 (RNase PH superfamily)